MAQSAVGQPQELSFMYFPEDYRWSHSVLMHGAGDEQIPLALAQRCFDAVGSKQKTFKVFTREEGGYHHCQIDNVSIGVACMWDWLETVLLPGK